MSQRSTKLRASRSVRVAMQVTFTRTAERRYRVDVAPEGSPPRAMEPAPGYDETMPHDLLHFVVESELEIENGIFGQLARGGDAGTFRALGPPRGREKRRSKRLLDEGRADSALSEKLVHEIGIAWWKGSPVPPAWTRTVARLTEVSARWRALAVGESLTLTWRG